MKAKSNVPTLVRMKINEDYVEKAYSGDEEIKKKMRVINALDAYSTYTPDERMSLKLAGSMTLEDIAFTDKLPIWLDEIVRDKGKNWFIKASIDDISTEIDKKKPQLQTLNDIQQEALNNMKDGAGDQYKQPAA